MIGIIIGIIAILFSRLAFKVEGYKGFATTILSVIIGLIVFAFADGLVACEIYSHNAIETTRTTEIVSSAELVTLQDNTSMSGSFFLGSGSVSDKQYYTFYCETEYGYKNKILDANDDTAPIYIKYIPTNETPHVDQYAVIKRKIITTDGSNSWLFSFFAWLKYNQYESGDLISETITDPVGGQGEAYYDSWRYEIHIPEGSIKTGYEIDLE